MNLKTFCQDRIIKLLYSLNLISATISNKRFLTILTFHRVLPKQLKENYPLPVLVVTPEELHWIVQSLKKMYHLNTVNEALLKLKTNRYYSKPLMAITFDDGQKDNYDYAFPILNKLGVKATFFIPASLVEHNEILWHDLLGFSIMFSYKNRSKLSKISNLLGVNLTACPSAIEAARVAVRKAKLLDHDKRKELIERFTSHLFCPNWARLMTWAQIKSIVGKGHEIGSHSMTHPILTKCSNAELQFEVIESRKLLENRLDTPIRSFCYPNGDFNSRIIKFVENAGYTGAVTTKWKSNRRKDSPFQLGRCDITSKSVKDFDQTLSHAKLSWRLSNLQRLVENFRQKQFS